MHALKHNEPVLLVGETSTGKTSVCQAVASIQRIQIKIVNCHQNMDASDLIGSYRPACRKQKNKLHDHQNQKMVEANSFVWHDGPLIRCMQSGDILLLDEISLADHAVLERLNSVLEPSRTMTVAEHGGVSAKESEVTAHSTFKFLATMNPGGDFGKKELSPALRNRFTEIWVPPIRDKDDFAQIISANWKSESLCILTDPIIAFVQWMDAKVANSLILTLRDILVCKHKCYFQCLSCVWG